MVLRRISNHASPAAWRILHPFAMHRTPTTCGLLLGLTLVGCRGTDAKAEHQHSLDQGPQALSGQLNTPLDATGDFESTLEFLLARHDLNDDGRITTAEYDRGDTSFERLDKNEDGAISGADWQRQNSDGRGGGSALEQKRTRNATAVLATYFQDKEPAAVTLAELEAAHGVYDTNADGAVDAEEFTCAFEAREVEVPGVKLSLGRSTPWEALLDGADVDEDGLINSSELASFFTAADGNDDQQWTFTASQGSRPKRTRTARPEPPEEGTRAPDFTLASPEGGDPITLSSFAGNKPVALIFGSYT